MNNEELLLLGIEKISKDEGKKVIQNGLSQSSGSIVIYQTSGGGISSEERYIQLIEKYKAEKIETQRDLTRIENALNKIRG